MRYLTGNRTGNRKSVAAFVGLLVLLGCTQALLERHSASKDTRLSDGTLMFGGTLAAHGGVRPTTEFAFELEDPVLGRKIAHAYRVRTLPILG